MKEILQQIVGGQHLSVSQAEGLLHTLVAGDQDPTLVGAVLAALKTKGETPDEVRGFAMAMRELSTDPNISPNTPTIDIVGTGGDGSGSLNLSTGAALLTAACGMPVVKHGNRSITSRSGSADVLEQLGVPIPKPEEAADLLARAGFTFLFAPYFHPAMKTIAPIRKALGVRTVFNILGPLTNPAAPPFYLIGAFDPAVAQLMADTLSGLPITRAFVVHGSAGWDEATPVGPFHLWDVRPGRVDYSVRDPADIGIPRCSTQDLAGGEVQENAAAIRHVFAGARDAHRHALTLGAGLALEVSAAADSWEQGVQLADDAIAEGRAKTLLSRLNAASNTQQPGKQASV